MKTIASALGADDDGVVRELPCRDCHGPVQCSALAWEFARRANHILSRRGEEPLRRDELIRCRGCGQRWQDEQTALDGDAHWRGVAIAEARDRAAQGRR